MADVDEAITGLRREGIFAGVMTMTRKASQAIAVMLVGVLLQLAHFNPGQPDVRSVHYVIWPYSSLGTTLLLIAGYGITSLYAEYQNACGTARECDRMPSPAGHSPRKARKTSVFSRKLPVCVIRNCGE